MSDSSRRSKIYRWLLRLLPFEFRSDFGAEMKEVFELQHEEAAARGGRAMFRLWGETLMGIFATAPREHLSALGADTRYGLRMMRRTPGFALVAVLTLALGIGILTAVFSFMDAFILRPLPFKEPDRLVHLWQTDVRFGDQEMRVSVPNFLDWKEQTTSFEDLGGYFYTAYRVQIGDEARSETVGIMTPNLFAILGVTPIRGRLIEPGDEHAVAGEAVLVSESFWVRRMGGRANVVGTEIKLDDTVCTIVGVMPSTFVFPFNGVDLWRPLSIEPWQNQRADNGPLLVVGRLSAGNTLERAETEITGAMENLVQRYPIDNQGKGVTMRPLHESLLFFYDMFRLTLVALFVASGFVVLIVCANLGNLQLSRAAGRAQEVAIRTTLGAGRLRLVRQLMTESLLLATIGGGLGTLGAYWAVQLLGQAMPGELYRVGEIAVDARTLLFALSTAIGVTLLFGLAPALQSTRPDLVSTLKEAGRGASAGRSSRRLRSGLVAFQVALAVMLLAGSALMIQTFQGLQQVETGFVTQGLITTELFLPRGKYSNQATRRVFFDELQSRLTELPSIESTSLVNPLPLNFESHGVEFEIPGRDLSAQPGGTPVASAFWIDPGYFQTMRTPLLQGRDFRAEDSADSTPVVILNREIAARYWPGETPVGKQLRLDPKDNSIIATIVGVAADSKGFLLSEQPQPVVYIPLRQQSSRRVFLTARVSSDAASAMAAIRRQVSTLEPDLPQVAPQEMADVVNRSLAPWLGGTAGLGLLGTGALLLAAMGIYGVISHSVGQRSHEIRIRLALGARNGDIFRLVFSQGIRFTLLGVVVGLVGALAVGRLLQTLLFGVGLFDPVALIGMPLVLVGVAALACLLPARRAVREFSASRLGSG